MIQQSKLQPSQYYAHPSLTRYFDHIQASPPVRSSADTLTPSFNLVAFDFENAPKPERKAEPSKKKDKKSAVEAEKAAAEEPVAAPSTDKVPKKEKKEKKGGAVATEETSKKKAAGGGKAAPVDEGEPVPSMIDLRVGRIIDSRLHLPKFGIVPHSTAF